MRASVNLDKYVYTRLQWGTPQALVYVQNCSSAWTEIGASMLAARRALGADLRPGGPMACRERTNR